jgi:N-methylhydantoinase A
MPLNLERARATIQEKVASGLGLPVEETALGIIKIAVAKMSLAVRGISVEKGYDPRDFVLLASGGAGPLHAMDIARELNIPKVIVPLLPAHFSALGMLMTDVKHDYVRTYYKSLTEADFDELKRIYDELASAGRDVLQKEGVEERSTRIEAFFDLRYIGQEFFLTVPVSRQEIYSGERETVRGSFDKLHDLRYSHKATEEPIEIVNVRLTAYGLRPKISFPEKSTTREDEVLKGYREVFFDDPKVPLKCPIYDREALPAGYGVEGPAVIEEYASTTPLSRGDAATVSASGEIIITVGGVG